MSRGRGPATLAALLLAGEALAGTARLSADRLELDDGVVTGEGHVTLELGQQRASGARFRYDLERGVVLLESGSWTRPEGTLSFAAAEIDLGQGQGVVLDGRYQGRDGRLAVEGERLAWLGEGELAGEGVRLTTCACDRPPWEVEAREVRVRLDDVAYFKGGWISICEVRLIPVPLGSVPLAERRSGLLVPRLGYGEDGLLLGAPVYLTLGPAADLTLTPELRSERGARALAELRYALPREQGGALGLAGGWDWRTEAARGALRLSHRQAEGRLRLGAEALVWSDPAYGADYGDSLLSRRAPWTEALLHAAYGPLRLESDTFQDDLPLGQRPMGAVVSTAGPLGPLALLAEGRLDAFGDAPDAGSLADPEARARARARLSGGRELGVLRVEGALEARATSWLDGAPWGEGRGGLGLALPLWAPRPGGVLILEPGLGLEGALALGEPDLRRPDDALPPPWALGPALSFRRVGLSGVPVSGWVELPWTEEGLDPRGALRLGVGHWEARAQAALALSEGQIAWDDGRLRAAVGAAVAGSLAQARGELAADLPGRLALLRPSWRGLVDVAEGALLSQTLGLRLGPACDCLELEASATFSEDRALPELGLRLDVW